MKIVRGSIIFILIFSVTIINSQQEFKIEGKILDSLNQSIPNVAVSFRNINDNHIYRTYTTLPYGFFDITLPRGHYIMSLRSLGYTSYSESISLTEDIKLKDIILGSRITALNEVIIKGNIENKIIQDATGITVSVSKDDQLKDVALRDILTLLPFIQVSDNGAISYQGKSATVMLNGKFKEISSQDLLLFLDTFNGEDIKNIKLISNPSAKYASNSKKIININLKKNRVDGIKGTLANRLENVDLNNTPSAVVSYKVGKLVLNLRSNPYSYKNTSILEMSRTFSLNDGLNFLNVTENDKTAIDMSYSANIDYSITSNHSVYLEYVCTKGETIENFTESTKKFEFESLDSLFTTNIDTSNDYNTIILNSGYRFDIGTDDKRFDIATTYKQTNYTAGRNLELTDQDNQNEITRVENSFDNANNKNKQLSARVDYSDPNFINNFEFEIGTSFSCVKIHYLNTYNTDSGNVDTYLLDSELSNDFDYREDNTSTYVNLTSNLKKLKYSVGIRYEFSKIDNFSSNTNTNNALRFNNFLPVVSLKYLFGSKNNNTINLSYRKGYILPPYLQLNSFQTLDDRTTIRRGNPELDQSIYHYFNLGFSLNNKYNFSIDSNFYSNLSAQTQLLEDNVTVITTENIGNRKRFKFSFNTNFKLSTWWQLYLDFDIEYNSLVSARLNNEITNYYFSLNNVINFPEGYRFTSILATNNGNSNGYAIPNSFTRLFLSSSLSKSFFDKKISIDLRVLDILGVNNRNQESFVIDETQFTNRVIFQAPKLSFRIAYRFEHGIKVDTKAKRKSKIDNGRL